MNDHDTPRDYVRENAMRSNQSGGQAFHQLEWHKERSIAVWIIGAAVVVTLVVFGIAREIQAERANPAASYVVR